MERATRVSDGPSPAELGGSGVGAALRRGLLAARPKFFTASVLPVLVGTAWAGAADHAFDGRTFALALLATVLAHAATNVYNDVGDDLNGTDPANTGRIYPYTGGSRFIQNGILSREQMLRLAIVFTVGALALGLWLTLLRGSGVLLLGLGGLALGLFYSQPGVQLSGRGTGELACAIGLGLLPVAGAAWLQAGRVDSAAWLLGTMVAVWVCLILLINEVPDSVADASVGKRTLAVRLGEAGTRVLYRLLTLVALAAGLALVLTHALPWWAAIPVVLLAVGGFKAAAGISLAPERRPVLQKSIEMTLGIHAMGSLALIVAALLR
jgi:1,4-dihydroxy-2-naphthoate polyprenyltransferase